MEYYMITFIYLFIYFSNGILGQVFIYLGIVEREKGHSA